MNAHRGIFFQPESVEDDEAQQVTVPTSRFGSPGVFVGVRRRLRVRQLNRIFCKGHERWRRDATKKKCFLTRKKKFCLIQLASELVYSLIIGETEPTGGQNGDGCRSRRAIRENDRTAVIAEVETLAADWSWHSKFKLRLIFVILASTKTKRRDVEYPSLRCLTVYNLWEIRFCIYRECGM